MPRTPGLIFVSLVSLSMMTLLLVNHLHYAIKFTNLAVCYSIMFVHLALKMIASLAAVPHRQDSGSDLGVLTVDVVVPIYNEDPHLLAAGVTALGRQDRRPRAVWLIDDGSHRDGIPFLVLEEPVVQQAIERTRAAGIEVICRRQVNQGKREALAVAFSESDADIFVTTDSDTFLQHDTLVLLLMPFSRPDVTSVGGTAYGQNFSRNLLTRAIELGFVMSFLQGRVAEGYFGAVRVNCGILAAYRGDIVRPNLHRFLNQSFLGRPVRAGDDRALTCFARERGRTEFQPLAIAYSALPENIGHLARQRMRWARSWCWGTLWSFRRPIRSPEFIFTLTQCLAILAYGMSMSIALVGTLSGAISASLLVWSVLVAVGIGYVTHLRYLLVARRDQPLWQRFMTWAASPLTSALYLFLLLPLYYVAMLRPAPRTWGTRQQVEVGLHVVSAPTSDPASVRPGRHRDPHDPTAPPSAA